MTLIDHSWPRIVLHTSRGTLTADKAIITVSTDLIARENIRFSPALPGKVSAAAGLPLGLADKVMLALATPGDLPPDGNLRGRSGTVKTGAYHLRPQGMACIEGYFGVAPTRANSKMRARARWRRRRSRRSRACSARFSQTTDAARRVALGARRLRARLLFARAAGPCGRPRGPRRACRWTIVLRGRGDLAELFSTAHGALQSGFRAAKEIIAQPAR